MGLITVDEIYEYIDSFAPFDTQDSFDNSGLLVGSGSVQTVNVTKAAVCLDITNDIVEEAHEKGAQLIISHHPVIFHRLSSIDRYSPVYRLVKYGIDALCVHTPLDMAKGGISDMMYELMGFTDIEKAETLHVVHPSPGLGYGKIARLEQPTTAAELAKKAKEAFGCEVIKYVDGGKPIKTAAVCSGAGNDEIYTCIEKGVDALITGDVKHHGFVDAANAGITVIDAGHYKTEVIICGVLKRKLSEKFPGIEVFIPDSECESCGYVVTTHRTEES